MSIIWRSRPPAAVSPSSSQSDITFPDGEEARKAMILWVALAILLFLLRTHTTSSTSEAEETGAK
eukprot:CAMPEP_0184316750 /NCGR_PEP_ID=MMETSP1049-20130417/92263_1 /TAXON_ID=77928 /ORGANISM="Proteomonas sulcata, Strain CCMP704" /LENGTH=64 /DNA_ID=CAMNT_0026635875 /DNA_START=622 /DNA_END=816 /DNA_ORIENTATION=-